MAMRLLPAPLPMPPNPNPAAVELSLQAALHLGELGSGQAARLHQLLGAGEFLVVTKLGSVQRVDRRQQLFARKPGPARTRAPTPSPTSTSWRRRC
jgi:hypothetical protein